MSQTPQATNPIRFPAPLPPPLPKPKTGESPRIKVKECPITFQPIAINEAYTNSQGHTYDVKALYKWINQALQKGENAISPLTRKKYSCEEIEKIGKAANAAGMSDADLLLSRNSASSSYYSETDDQNDDEYEPRNAEENANALLYDNQSIASFATTSYYEGVRSTLLDRFLNATEASVLAFIIGRIIQSGHYTLEELKEIWEEKQPTNIALFEQAKSEYQATPSTSQGGANKKYKYKGKYYKIRIGKRNGRYILVNGEKIYIGK